MSVHEEPTRPPAEAASAPDPASAPAPGFSAREAEAAAEAVPRRRLLSLPEDFSSSVRHYHMHEHHYHVWHEYHGGGGWSGSESCPAPWQLWQPRHTHHRKRPPCCSGAWAPPWVFGEFPWSKRAGRFSLAGGLVFLVAMALCRGVVWLVRVHRPQPALE